jgi:hypothetical protein
LRNIIHYKYGFISKLFKKRSNRFINQFSTDEIIIISEGANFFGQESMGVWQIRGNGVLLLTETDLHFQLWLPKRSFKIALNSIFDITIPKSFLGKTRFHPLLKVSFRNDLEQVDSMAWEVRHLSEWIKYLPQNQK